MKLLSAEDQSHQSHQSSLEYGRPRRPSPDTVAYLSGLPLLDESLAAQQAREYAKHFRNKEKVDGGDGYSPETPEYPQVLGAAHAALSSIFREVASLACEEVPSRHVETLVRVSCRYSLVAKRVVLESMSGYWVFLSTHRFGSHVAQTVLRCVVAECEVNLDEFDDGQELCEGRMVVEDAYGNLLQNEDGSGGPVSRSLSKLILQTLEELKPFVSELALHVCGSHVVRSALCIVTGAEFVDAFPLPGSDHQNDWDAGVLAATRRGKLKEKKKKKKTRGSSSEEDGGRTPQVRTVVKEMTVVKDLMLGDFKNPADALLHEMVKILSLFDEKGGGGKVLPPGNLQHRACHPSAGPLLVQMLRLLSYLDYRSRQLQKKPVGKQKFAPDRRLGILPQEPTYSPGSQAESFVHRLLCWDVNTTDDGKSNDETGAAIANQPYAGDIIYGLSGEPRGSILLEAIFRCCPDAFHDAVCSAGGFYEEATLRDYIQHRVSNFVVQALLNSVRDQEQASRMVKCLCSIVEDGSILMGASSTQACGSKTQFRPCDNRMGIIWRACEMCVAKGSSQDQEQILSALSRGFTCLANCQEGYGESCKNGNGKNRKKRSRCKGLSVEECIPRLLGLAPGSCEGEGEYAKDGSRLTLDTAGTRALYSIFHYKERVRKKWVSCIVRIYGVDDLVKIANDGLGSRCIIDGLLDGPDRATASKLIAQKLSGRISYLAAERVGHHTVEKLFRALPTMEGKAAISAELSHSLNRLGSNAMGRSVIVSCAVKEYLEGESVWKDALAKQQVKDSWLEEILGEKEGSGEKATESNGKKRKKEKEKKKKRKSF